MNTNRKVEIFSAGCSLCEDAIELVRSIACSNCDVVTLDMKDAEIQKRALQLGIRSIPAVVIDGKLAECCSNRGIDKEVLRAAGVGN